MRELKIVVNDYVKANVIAAEEFAKYYGLITGKTPEITDKDGDYDVVAIGNETNNDYICDLYFKMAIDKFPYKYGSEEFSLKSYDLNGKKLLIVGGGRGRATLYAVYHYFEMFGSVRYFWDGERIPRKDNLPIEGIDVFESPRFKIRGQRYFAHRSLHRFQAEHWSFEDWKREIDWQLKKKLNTIALFIGLDDLFQRTFGISYESAEKEYLGPGYENRKSFWPLKFRGQLREKIYAYIHDRDLITMENCGTMTHWNTKSPQEFLDKYKPSYFKQTTVGYSDERALVWDIREQRNFDLYFELTKGDIKNFAKPEYFYTIGFGERMFSDDREENLRMKLFCYHKLVERLQREYPGCKLAVCGWDLWFKFLPEEVNTLAKGLDPDMNFIMDYNSDSYDEANFTKWGIINEFPHTFGMFHAYEMNSDIRGDYEVTEERMKYTLNDEKCEGFLFWPELSHSDTFALEYYPKNAWKPLSYTFDEGIEIFCDDRYNEGEREEMRSVWRKFKPVIPLMHWNMDNSKPAVMPMEYFFNINWRYKIDKLDFFDSNVDKFLPLRNDMVEIVETSKKYLSSGDELLKRDCFDIIKTVLGRYLHYHLALAKRYYAEGKASGNFDKTFEILSDCRSLLKGLGEFLGTREEFTLSDSLKKLAEVHPIPDDFEYVLKDNAYNGYCRSYIFELFEDLFLKEYDMFIGNLSASVKTGEGIKVDLNIEKGIFDSFLNKPLKEMAAKKTNAEEVADENIRFMKNMLKYE